MINKIPSDLFKPVGRTPRLRFVIALVIVIIAWVLFGKIGALLPDSGIKFLLGAIGITALFYSTYCVYVRRLHDFGLSAGILAATLFLIFLAMLVALSMAGMGEYFEIMIANPEIAEDAERSRALAEEYQNKVASNVPWAGPVSLIPLYVLTLACAFWPSEKNENKYGPVPE